MKRTFSDTCKLRGVALNADLLAKTLAVTGAIAVSDENILVALELAHKLVPCGLHGLAVPAPFVFWRDGAERFDNRHISISDWQPVQANACAHAHMQHTSAHVT